MTISKLNNVLILPATEMKVGKESGVCVWVCCWGRISREGSIMAKRENRKQNYEEEEPENEKV